MTNSDIPAYVTPQGGISKSDARQTQTDAGVGTNRAHRDDLEIESEPSDPLARSATRNYANTLEVITVDTDDRANWDVQYSGLAEIGSAGPGSSYADTGYGVYTDNGYLESVTENTKSGKGSTNLPRLDTRQDHNNKPVVYESYLNPESTLKADEGKQHDKVAFIVLLLLFLLFIVIAIVTGIFVILFVRVKNDFNDLRNENDSLRSKLEELEVKFNESSNFSEILTNRLLNLENETLSNQTFSLHGQNVTERIYALENFKLDTRLEKIEDENLANRVSTLEGENFATRIRTLESLEIQTQLTSLEAGFNYTEKQLSILGDFMSISEERLKNAELHKIMREFNDTAHQLFSSLNFTEILVQELTIHTSLGDNNLTNQKLILISSTIENTADIDDLTKIFTELNDTIWKFQTFVNSTEEIIQEISAHISIEEAALNNRQLKTDIAQLNLTALSQIDANCQNLNHTVVDLQQSVTTLTDDIDQTRGDVIDNRQLIEKVDSSTTNINSELSTLKQDVQSSKSRIALHDLQIEEIVVMIREL